MKSLKNTVSKKILFWLVVSIAIFTTIHLTLQYINTEYFNLSYGNFYEVTNRFDFDDEASIPTWFAQALFLLLAMLAGLTSYLEKNKRSRWVWTTLSVLAVLGSVDEVSTVHESGLQSIHLLFFNENAPTLLANAWVVIVPLVLIIATLFLYFSYKVLPKPTVKLFVIGAVVYISGAVGVDIITSTLLESTAFIEQGVFVAIEEVSELIGLTIMVFATSSYLESNYGKRISRSISALK